MTLKPAATEAQNSKETEDELASLLTQTAPFHGISPDETRAMLGCLGARTMRVNDGQAIFRMGDSVHELGIVLEGGVRIERVDPWGEITVLGFAAPLDTFAESYACAPDTPMLVDAVAAGKCRIALLDMRRVLHTCRNSCGQHARLISNLLALSARKNIELSRRAFHTAPKTIRGKLLAYLGTEAAKARSREFTIPYNRQQLASYLGVDRSALSSELSKMQKDGILNTHRNRFELLIEADAD